MPRRSYQLCHKNTTRNNKKTRKELQTLWELKRKESDNLNRVKTTFWETKKEKGLSSSVGSYRNPRGQRSKVFMEIQVSSTSVCCFWFVFVGYRLTKACGFVCTSQQPGKLWGSSVLWAGTVLWPQSRWCHCSCLSICYTPAMSQTFTSMWVCGRACVCRCVHAQVRSWLITYIPYTWKERMRESVQTNWPCITRTLFSI